MSHSEPLRYPYQWGRGIINAFVEKYVRGTNNLAHLLGMTNGEVRHTLIITLCKDYSVRFEAVKRVIKILEDYSRDDLKRYSDKERKLLYKSLLFIGEDMSIKCKSDETALDGWQNFRLEL